MAHNLFVTSKLHLASKLCKSVLGKRRGRAKIAVPSCRSLRASPLTNDAITLVGHHARLTDRYWDHGATPAENTRARSYTLLRVDDEEPDAYAPNHELRLTSSVDIPSEDDFAVKIVATSPCGNYVACLHGSCTSISGVLETPDTLGTGTYVTLWDMSESKGLYLHTFRGKSTTPKSPLRVLRRPIYGSWFHQDGLAVFLDLLVQEVYIKSNLNIQ